MGLRPRSSVLAALALLLLCAPALAQESPDALARRHFDSGVAYLQESDYEHALEAFQKAWELSKRPEILLNIATVHERTSNLDAALAALRKYQELAPDSEHTETVKLRIANLEKRKAEEPAPSVSGGPGANSGSSGAKAIGPEQKDVGPDRKPAGAPNRTPAYIALGVGAAAGIGAIVTGVMASAEHSDKKDSCAPNCSEDDVSAGKTLAVTSTVLSVVAVIGIGVGASLWVTATPTTQQAGAVPHVKVGALPGRADVTARWVF